MSSALGWTDPYTGGEWMRNQEKRVGRQERRAVPSTASELLGPGFGPTATQLVDWNSDDASFNGMFFSLPGAMNTPDGTRSWIGMVVSQGNGWGVQRVLEFHITDIIPVEWVREFTTTGVSRTYSAWSPAVLRRPIAETTGDYTATLEDLTILANGPATITLQSAVVCGVGRTYTIKNIGGGVITITGTGNNIEGSGTLVLAATNDVVSVQTDGTNWYIV